MPKEIRKRVQKPARADSRQREEPSGPVEFAPNSTQPVEALDKSTQTHNAASQQRALQQNEDQEGVKGKAPTAAQHATGSFSGTTEPESGENKRSQAENPKKNAVESH